MAAAGIASPAHAPTAYNEDVVRWFTLATVFWGVVGFTAGTFILPIFHLWWAALVSGILALIPIVMWLWTGTALIPEKPSKPVGLGVTLPLYASGSASVGWWAMFISMLGDTTAFLSLVFGYFFYWTSRPGLFDGHEAIGWWWPSVAVAAGAGAWLMTAAARRLNRSGSAGGFYAALVIAIIFAVSSAAALVAGPVSAELDPERHVYPAIVWALVGWTVVHLGLGVLMLLYCAARRVAGRMTSQHEIDIANVALYWHFAAFTLAVTAAVVVIR